MNTTTARAAVPAVTEQIADIAAELGGFHPALDNAVSSLVSLLNADLTADQSMGLVAALGGAEDSLTRLIGLVVRQIANPDSNPALASLSAERQQRARRLGAEFSAAIDDDDLRQIAAETCAVLDEDSPLG